MKINIIRRALEDVKEAIVYTIICLER